MAIVSIECLFLCYGDGEGWFGVSLNGYPLRMELNFKERIFQSASFMDEVTIQLREESITSNISMTLFVMCNKQSA